MARVVAASSQAVSEAVVAFTIARIGVMPTNRWPMVYCKVSAPECVAQIFAAKKKPRAGNLCLSCRAKISRPNTSDSAQEPSG